jgi:hypothetical protein
MSARLFALILAVLGGGLLVSGCASSSSGKLVCAQRDWYELGRRDGSQGATLERRADYRKECGSDFENQFSTVYENGRNAGLVEYCQPDSAFQLGRMGLAYMYVCPSTMESPFLSAYRRGQQARMLELKKRDLDAKIESLSTRLQVLNESSFERRGLLSQIEELRKLRAANERELGQVSK